jgi:hypothetical protein
MGIVSANNGELWRDESERSKRERVKKERFRYFMGV